VNNDEDKAVLNHGDYSKFENLKLVAPTPGLPDGDNCFAILIKCGKPQVICLKQDLEKETLQEATLKEEYKEANTVILIDSEEKLREQCKEKGTKNERQADINQWYWAHEYGVVLYYENKTTDFSL